MTEEKTIPMRFKELEETIKLQNQVIEKAKSKLEDFVHACPDSLNINLYAEESLEEINKMLEGLE